MSDAYMGPMAYPFYDDMGFSKVEIAYVSKIYGMIATIAGGIAGGLIINRFGIMRSLLWLAYCRVLPILCLLPSLMLATTSGCLPFPFLWTTFRPAWAPRLWSLTFLLCATLPIRQRQYALLSSLMSFARDVFAATSGFLADRVSGRFLFLTACGYSRFGSSDLSDEKIPPPNLNAGLNSVIQILQRQIAFKKNVCFVLCLVRKLFDVFFSPAFNVLT